MWMTRPRKATRRISKPVKARARARQRKTGLPVARSCCFSRQFSESEDEKPKKGKGKAPTKSAAKSSKPVVSKASSASTTTTPPSAKPVAAVTRPAPFVPKPPKVFVVAFRMVVWFPDSLQAAGRVGTRNAPAGPAHPGKILQSAGF